MPYIPSLPEGATLPDVFRAFPDTAGPLLDYHEVLMRGPSPLRVDQRELVAAYVSGLNACGYCHGVHTATAETFGVPAGTLRALLADLDTAPVDEPIRALLAYVRILTLDPSRITPSDARRVFDAGWDERALYDTVAVCALFNFMNRLVDGLGITAGPDYFDVAGRRLATAGYAPLKDRLREGD
jgi:uncharacterized peroxidase-related enzyme